MPIALTDTFPQVNQAPTRATPPWKSIELLGAFGGGLILLGIGVVIFDFFAARVIKRIYPDPEYWNEELNFPTHSRKDQKSFPRRKRLYQDSVSHRFGKWGIGLLNGQFGEGEMLLHRCGQREYKTSHS